MLNADDQLSEDAGAWHDFRLLVRRYLIYALGYTPACSVIGYALAGMYCGRIFTLSKWHGLQEHQGLSAIEWGLLVANVGLIFLCASNIALHDKEDRYPERTILWGGSIILLEGLCATIYLFVYGYPQDF